MKGINDAQSPQGDNSLCSFESDYTDFFDLQDYQNLEQQLKEPPELVREIGFVYRKAREAAE